jgi:hypothetical protein
MTAAPSKMQLALAWVVTLIIVAAGASLLSGAQSNADKKIVTGSDLGFRIDSDRGGVPTGHFVIRQNGNWVEVKEAAGISRLTQ